MEKRVVLITIAFIILSLYSSSVFAIAPMGPPRATLQDGQWSFGLELSHSDMDLESFGTREEVQPGPSINTEYRFFEIEGLESNMFFGRIGIGMWENWDVFFRLGASDAEGEIPEDPAGSGSSEMFDASDGSHGFGWGFGTKATFYEQGEVAWGGLIQLNWMNPGEGDITDDTDSNFSGNAEFDLWEVQVAVGPTVDYGTYRIYGGPFLHFVNGDLDISGNTIVATIPVSVEYALDVREKAQLGGYVGAQFYLDDVSSIYTEGSFTSDVWGLGVGIIWRY